MMILLSHDAHRLGYKNGPRKFWTTEPWLWIDSPKFALISLSVHTLQVYTRYLFALIACFSADGVFHPRRRDQNDEPKGQRTRQRQATTALIASLLLESNFCFCESDSEE